MSWGGASLFCWCLWYTSLPIFGDFVSQLLVGESSHISEDWGGMSDQPSHKRRQWQLCCSTQVNHKDITLQTLLWVRNFGCASLSLFLILTFINGTSLLAQTVNRLSTIWETRVRSLDREDLLEKEMTTHSSIHAWKIPWTEEPCRLQSMGSQRVGHDWATSLSLSVFSVKERSWLLSSSHSQIQIITQY